MSNVQPSGARARPRLHDHCLVHDAYFCYVYFARNTHYTPCTPEVALFVLEIPSLGAIQIAVDNCNTSCWKCSNDNISFNEL